MVDETVPPIHNVDPAEKNQTEALQLLFCLQNNHKS